MQSSQDGSRAVPFDDQAIAGKLAAIFDQPIDAGIVERADHDVHRLGHQRVGEGAELPIAEMRGGEEDAASGFFGFQIMFEAFVTDPLMNVLAIDLGKAREDPDEAGDGAENFVGDGAALGWRFLRVREFQVAHRGAAQAGDGEIEQRYVEAGQAERCVGQRPQQE